MRLLEGPQRRAVRNIDARKVKSPAAIVPAASVELRAMVRKCKQVPCENDLESQPGGLHLRFRLGEFPLGSQHVGETPEDFRIAARNSRRKKRLGFVGAAT